MDSAADSSPSGVDGIATPPSGCQYEHFGNSSVITLKPELNDVKWDAIESIGNTVEGQLKSHEPSKVVFDLTPLNYVGSAMVALVARWWKRVTASGGQCAVAVDDDNVMEVLKLAKLDTHWDIVPSRELALKKLGVTASPALPSATATTEATSGPIWPLAMSLVGLTVGVLGVVLGFGADLDPNAVSIMLLVSGVLMLLGGAAGFLKHAVPGRGLHGVFALVGLAFLLWGGFRMAAGDSDVLDDDVEEFEAEIDADRAAAPSREITADPVRDDRLDIDLSGDGIEVDDAPESDPALDPQRFEPADPESLLRADPPEPADPEGLSDTPVLDEVVD